MARQTVREKALALAAALDRGRPVDPARTAEVLRALVRQVDHAERCIGEGYQVLGALAGRAGVFGHPEVVRALDNLSASEPGDIRWHDDLLPWPRQDLGLQRK